MSEARNKVRKKASPKTKEKIRCPWVNLKNPGYIRYHDKEWGRPVRRDQKHFEYLILEGAQAGLSWETILNKRAGYKELFADFDVVKVSKYSDKRLEKILTNPKIIRNRLKVFSARTNALAFLEIQKDFGSFNKYIWSFTEGKVIKNSPEKLKDYPSKTPLSDEISKDLKKRGFKFIGSTIIYAYLQAVGVVDDHSSDCFCN